MAREFTFDTNSTDAEILDAIRNTEEKIELHLNGRQLTPTLLMQLPFPKIETLDLSGCQLDDKATLALAFKLQPQGSPLQNINLSNTNLADQGVCKIANSLKGKSLNYLNLNFTGISAQSTAQAIGKLNVKDLELNGHKFTLEDLSFISSTTQNGNVNLAATTRFNPGDIDPTYKEMLRKSNPARLTSVELVVCTNTPQPRAGSSESELKPPAPAIVPEQRQRLVLQHC